MKFPAHSRYSLVCMKAPSEDRALCDTFHRAIELIGKRWTGAIIFMLLGSPKRFAELRAGIPDITDKMLSDRLQELERESILIREVLPASPVRVEYTLTAKGRALARTFESIGEWAHAWIDRPATKRARKKK
jgi:DNA-binding HxlR family transcriptional regulator